jgi:hypothetical protein
MLGIGHDQRVQLLRHGVNFIFASEPLFEESDIDQMVWFVLNNCSQVENYVDYILITTFYIVVCYFLSCTYGKFFCRMFRDELERQGVPNIRKNLRQGFQTWFRNHVSVHRLRF